MSNLRRHPADATLILALDRELSLARRWVLDRHVTTCQPCRARLEAFAEATREAARLCDAQAADDVHDTAALRQRLQERMDLAGEDWSRSWWFRFQRAASGLPPVRSAIAAAAFLVLMLRLIQPALHQTVQSEPFAYAPLPISRFTPGATSSHGVSELCSGLAPKRQAVSVAVRQHVLRQYQMEHVDPSEYELDYLITPELGGVADARNLWPERYDSGLWNARVKDELEELMPRLVCDGEVDLAVAQRAIADNWIDAYKKYFNTRHPVLRQAGFAHDHDTDDGMPFEYAPRVPSAGAMLVSLVRPAFSPSAGATPIDVWEPREPTGSYRPHAWPDDVHPRGRH